jgi:hypothetical protein
MAIVVMSRFDPLDIISCFPAGKGLRNTQFPGGAPEILSSGNVTLKSGDTLWKFP